MTCLGKTVMYWSLEFCLMRVLLLWINYDFLQIYIPLTLIVCCSWVTFWLVKTEKGTEIPARTGLGATTVLSIVTIGFSGKRYLQDFNTNKTVQITVNWYIHQFFSKYDNPGVDFIKQFMPYAWNSCTAPIFSPNLASFICTLHPIYCIFSQFLVHFMLYAVRPPNLKVFLGF
jgi:hypothetical protein